MLEGHLDFFPQLRSIRETNICILIALHIYKYVLNGVVLCVIICVEEHR